MSQIVQIYEKYGKKIHEKKKEKEIIFCIFYIWFFLASSQIWAKTLVGCMLYIQITFWSLLNSTGYKQTSLMRNCKNQFIYDYHNFRRKIFDWFLFCFFNSVTISHRSIGCFLLISLNFFKVICWKKKHFSSKSWILLVMIFTTLDREFGWFFDLLYIFFLSICAPCHSISHYFRFLHITGDVLED